MLLYLYTGRYVFFYVSGGARCSIHGPLNLYESHEWVLSLLTLTKYSYQIGAGCSIHGPLSLYEGHEWFLSLLTLTRYSYQIAHIHGQPWLLLTP